MSLLLILAVWLPVAVVLAVLLGRACALRDTHTDDPWGDER